MKSLRKALQERRPCITVELPSQLRAGEDNLLAVARELAPHVDAIQLAEPPLAEAPFSPLAMAARLLHCGIDAVPQLTCRDRNRIALHSDLLGMRALGVSSLVLDEGQLPPPGAMIAKPVFDMNQKELVAAATAMNDEPWGDAGHEFLPGISVTAERPGCGWSAEPLIGMATAGARFLVIRPCLDAQVLEDYLRALVEHRVTWHYSLILTLTLENGVDECLQRLQRALAAPGVSGINLLAGDCREDVLAVLASLHRDF